jgi:very-short-patch-repair endonuclease
MTAHSNIDPNNRRECWNDPVDARIAALAERQHGLVNRRQLVAMGLRHHEIDYRVRVGRLIVVHRGVYAVGHARLTLAGRWMGAVLANGDGAVLFRHSAGALWGVRRTDRTAIDVATPRWGRSGRGIERHCVRLRADEVTVRNGIPTTTVTRTLIDLAAVLTPRQLARVVNQGEVLQLTDPVPLSAAVERYRGRRGIAALRALALDASITRSELEDRFRGFLADSGLPRPQTNALVGPYEVDCLWREERVVVELDGRDVHDTRLAFEADRARDRALQAAGYRVVRITWRQLRDEPAAVAADLRALLRLGRTKAG